MKHPARVLGYREWVFGLWDTWGAGHGLCEQAETNFEKDMQDMKLEKVQKDLQPFIGFERWKSGRMLHEVICGESSFFDVV